MSGGGLTTAKRKMKPKKQRGSCFCGNIVFEVHFPSRFHAHCHCPNCRKAHGAAFVTFLGFKSDQVEILAGRNLLKTYNYKYRFKRKRVISQRLFCRNCGSTLFFRSTRWAGETHVATACLDGPADRNPSSDVYTRYKVDWIKN